MLLEVKNLSFSYGKEKILENISFDLEEGEILCILGANGAGKTTLVKNLLTFERPTSGTCKLLGKDLSSYERGDFWKIISYLPQAKETTFSYTGLEMVSFGLSPTLSFFASPGERDLALAARTLEDLGVGDLKDKNCRKMSGGEFQMVLLARALVKGPRLLVLDEPESNLDIKNQEKILRTIKNLSKERKISAIINTHSPQNALRLADKVLLLEKDLTYDFGGREIINEESIKRAFDLDVHLGVYETAEKAYPYLVVLD